MSDEIKAAAEAVVKLNEAFVEFKSANDSRLLEIEAKGASDPITTDRLAKIEAAMDVAQKTADEAVLASKRAQRQMHDGGEGADLEAKAAQWERMAGASLGRSFTGAMPAEGLKAYRAIGATYFRKGMDGLSDLERKALSVGGDPTGGYVVHPDMSGRIVTQVHETSPMRAYASVQTISSDALEGLYDLNLAGAEWVGELSARNETTTPNLGAYRIPAHELAAKPRISQKMLDDAEINIEQWLADKIGLKFSLMEAAAFVTGNGVAKPRGFLSYASGTTNPGTIERVLSGVNGNLAAAPAGGDTLLDGLYSLKQQYRSNATWFMNRTTTKLVRKAKDSDGAYIWSPGVAAGQPAQLLGYPMAAFEDMPDPATGSLSIAVGDMQAAYQIVDRIGIRTLRDPFSAKPSVEFYTTKRVGGDVVNFEALKLIEFSA
jgi:HK97 family phage major capsid protein